MSIEHIATLMSCLEDFNFQQDKQHIHAEFLLNYILILYTAITQLIVSQLKPKLIVDH